MEDYVFRDVPNRKKITLRAVDIEGYPTNIREVPNGVEPFGGYLRTYVLDFGHITERYKVTTTSTQTDKFEAFLGHNVIKIVEELNIEEENQCSEPF